VQAEIEKFESEKPVMKKDYDAPVQKEDNRIKKDKPFFAHNYNES